MNTETVIRVSEPRELLALIPYRLGFHPRESLVLLSLRRPRNRIGLVIRADIGDVGHPAAGPDVARDLVRHLLDDGAHDALAVVYTDRPRDELGPLSVLGRALANVREHVDWFDPPGPWVVGPQGYGIWGDDVECGPATAPLQDLEYTQTGAAMVLEGHAVAADRAALAIERSGDGPRRRAALRAASAARRRYREVRGRCGGGAPVPGAAFGLATGVAAEDTGAAVRSPGVAGRTAGAATRHLAVAGSGQAEMVAWRRGETERWERLLALAAGPAELPGAELGRMLVGLADIAVRDAIILSMVGPVPRRLGSDEAVAWALGAVFEPGGPRPPYDVVVRAEVVLGQVAATAARGCAAPALVLLAWLAWWAGEGARADVLAVQCLEEQPGHRLATLVATAVQQGLPPGWVRQS